MNARDLLETSWHVALVLLVLPGGLRLLLAHNWLRRLVLVLIVAALAYHVAITMGCHRDPRICL